MKQLKDNLTIFPDDPTFPLQFLSLCGDVAVPSTSRQKFTS